MSTPDVKFLFSLYSFGKRPRVRSIKVRTFWCVTYLYVAYLLTSFVSLLTCALICLSRSFGVVTRVYADYVEESSVLVLANE